MTSSEYHCGNCPRDKYEYPEHIVYCCWLDANLDTEVVKATGCFSHPSAQAALRAEGAKTIPLKSCFGNFEDCPCDNECSVSEFCSVYCKQKSVNSCGMTESQCGFVIEHEKTVAFAEGAKQERERVLKSIEDWVGDASQELDYGYYDPTVYVFELEAKIKYLRQSQSTGGKQG